MKIISNKQRLMEGDKVVREIYFITFQEQGHPDHTITVGKKTFEKIEEMSKGPKQGTLNLDTKKAS